jgi:thiol-disulfide isomerase/thioredoxin
LSAYRGKPVVLNFWATWCPPCVEEVPSLVALQKQMGDKVTIIAVSADVDDDGYHTFVKKNMPGMLTVRDGNNKSNGLYGTYAFPETFIIDRNGVVKRKFVGAVNWTSPEIVDYLNKL